MMCLASEWSCTDPTLDSRRRFSRRGSASSSCSRHAIARAIRIGLTLLAIRTSQSATQPPRHFRELCGGHCSRTARSSPPGFAMGRLRSECGSRMEPSRDSCATRRSRARCDPHGGESLRDGVDDHLVGPTLVACNEFSLAGWPSDERLQSRGSAARYQRHGVVGQRHGGAPQLHDRSRAQSCAHYGRQGTSARVCCRTQPRSCGYCHHGHRGTRRRHAGAIDSRTTPVRRGGKMKGP